ncbi:MAG: hypothetical protein AYK19_11610 [Theionarchaea archaeon DG-70-1]|nr:MAG: hypothetical protein AYK19_11610 [Theionarchaea archaeon DG-70-1]
MSDDKLILNFEKHTFLWDHIQSISLEGERKLVVVFEDNGKCKKKVYDLKWLSEKKDFINNLKNDCIGRNISYEESELALSSRVGLLLQFWGNFG